MYVERVLRDPCSSRRYPIYKFNWHSRHYNWPYCLQRLKSGKWVILNRSYKPLNVCDYHGLWVDYEQYAQDLPKMTPEIIEQLSFKPVKSKDDIHLYNDGCVPERSKTNKREYLRRLQLLAEVMKSEGDTRTCFEVFCGDIPDGVIEPVTL